MDEKTPDFKKILQILVEHDVKFVVIGGIGAVLQGAPIATFDLDVVHLRSQKNLRRLQEALRKLDAFYRTGAQRRLRPDLSHLASPGHQLLMTRFGPLDVLGSAGLGSSYPELIKEAETFELGSLRFDVLSLEALIRLKEETGHRKDQAVLEILRAVLDEREKSQDS